jgi:hypothetical protein
MNQDQDQDLDILEIIHNFLYVDFQVDLSKEQ